MFLYQPAMVLLWGFGPSIELVAFILFVSIAAIIGLLLFVLKATQVLSISAKRIVKIVLSIPVLLVVLCFAGIFIYRFSVTPMTVRKYNLSGTYVIDRAMFKGKNADWQYKHFWLEIDDDTLFLNVMRRNQLVKRYAQKINYAGVDKHTFFTFHDNYWTDRNLDSLQLRALLTDSSKHHMLRLNPKLMSNPFNFRLILYSTQYQHLFFKKGDWEEE